MQGVCASTACGVCARSFLFYSIDKREHGMSRPRIAIVSLAAANRTSERYGLERAGADVYFAERGSEMIGADALVVPGVANIGHVIKALDTRGFRAPLERAITSAVPIL